MRHAGESASTTTADQRSARGSSATVTAAKTANNPIVHTCQREKVRQLRQRPERRQHVQRIAPIMERQGLAEEFADGVIIALKIEQGRYPSAERQLRP